MVAVHARLDEMDGQFNRDVEALPAERRAPAERISARVIFIMSGVTYELDETAVPPTPVSAAWLHRHIEASRVLVLQVDDVIADMAGFLTTGTIPSEARSRRQMWIFSGVAVAVGGLGYYLWWRNEMAEEAEQERMLASGELEDCGCTG